MKAPRVGMFCVLNVSVSVAWCDLGAVVLPDVIIGGNWAKSAWVFSVVFIITVCKSIISQN